MAERIDLVRGDTRPQLRVVLTDEVTAEPINLTGATGLLKFRELGTTTLSATLTGTVTDPLNGIIIFEWGNNSLNTAGEFEGELSITFPDSSVQTAYDILRFRVREDF